MHRSKICAEADNAPAHASFVVQQFLASTNTTVTPILPTHRTSPSVIFSYSQDELVAQEPTLCQD